MLLNEDSENYWLFSSQDKLELLFQLFSLFVVGGSMNQPDTQIDK